MLFASEWHSDTQHLADEDVPPARELFARRVSDLLERGESGAALVRAKAGTAEFPGYATGWYMRAKAECKHREYEAALASTEACLALEPRFFSAWNLLEIIHVQLGRLAAARLARQRFEELQGTRSRAPLTATQTGRKAEPAVTAQPSGETSRKSLILVKPAHSGSFETPTLAEVYRRQGLLDRALGVYRRILDRHPEDAGAQAMVRKLEDELASRRQATTETA
jgi:tetratricopeptide (TPR) repeat protein